jgi:hypothetical protein
VTRVRFAPARVPWGIDDMTQDESSTDEYRDPARIDLVGVFPDNDSAQTRHIIVHPHRFLEPKGLKRKPA